MGPTEQMEPFVEQFTLSSFFVESAPVAVSPQLTPVEVKHTAPESDTNHQILVRRERILELQKEIEDSEEEILNAEFDEGGLEPPEDEDIFDVVVPGLNMRLYDIRSGNEIEIDILKEEIVKLEGDK